MPMSRKYLTEYQYALLITQLLIASVEFKFMGIMMYDDK